MGKAAGMTTDNDETNDAAIEQLITSAIQKGTFVPTSRAHLANTDLENTHPASTHQPNADQVQAAPLQAGSPAPAQPNSAQPDSLSSVSPVSGDCVKIPNQTPLETHRHFLNQGYRCVTSIIASDSLNIPALQETYSWDQQLILSVWHGLQVLEGSSESTLQRVSSSSAWQHPLLEWFQTTVQLSPPKASRAFF